MTSTELVRFLLQIAIMLSVALLFGGLMRRIRQPAVLGELIGGVLLGPTVLGAIIPGAYAWVFAAGDRVAAGRETMITFGMLFFLFAAGLEVNLTMTGRLASRIAGASLAGIAVPFTVGVLAVCAFPTLWGEQPAANPTSFALFVGAALSISALPVIARILMDLGLLWTDLGVTVMSAATIDDLVGWTMFAVVLSTFAPHAIEHRSVWLTLVLTIGLFVVVVGGGRWLIRRVRCWGRGPEPALRVAFELPLLLVLLASAAAEFLNIHAFLGAYLVGVAASENTPGPNPRYESVSSLAVRFFAPIYFVSVGLKANFANHFDLLLVVMVLLVASVGKIAGVTFGAWVGGSRPREALAVGFAMNARGAMEIILASIALQQRLIDERVFVALIVMAVVTSLMSGPILKRLAHPGKTSAAPAITDRVP